MANVRICDNCGRQYQHGGVCESLRCDRNPLKTWEEYWRLPVKWTKPN